MSLDDLVTEILRETIPVVLATTGLQYKQPLSQPGVEPRTWATDWTNLVGHFQKRLVNQQQDEAAGAMVLRERAHVTVADTITLYEGAIVRVGSEDPFIISGTEEQHQRRPGIVTYAAYRDVPLIFTNGRAGGAL